MKTLANRILALLLLILVAPVVVLIALAIKLDSNGPVLFRQQRYGFNNKPFTVLKFRTMYDDRPLEERAPEVRRNDPRVTRVGRFLRRTNLDELPQLFNVLQGVMSLVGPRPHPIPPGARLKVSVDDTSDQGGANPGLVSDGEHVATLRWNRRGEPETGTLISETALDRFRASVAWMAYPQADFEVTEALGSGPRSTSDTWGFVIVTRKVAGVERRYRAGPSLSWTDAFDADIRRGVYLITSPNLPVNVVALQNRRRAS